MQTHSGVPTVTRRLRDHHETKITNPSALGMSSDISHISRGSSPMMITLTYLNSPLLPQIALSTPLMTAWATEHHMMHSSPREEHSQPEQPKGETFSRTKSLGRQSEVVMIPELGRQSEVVMIPALIIISTNWL